MPFKIDLTTKTAAIGILLFLDLLFLAVALHAQPAVSARVWEYFGGSNAALLLALNAGGGNKTTPPAPAVAGE